MPKNAEVPPEEYLLEENEERSMIEPKSYENPKLKDLIKIIIEWINDELVDDRIIIQDIEEDLYDGQVCDLYLSFVTFTGKGQSKGKGVILEGKIRRHDNSLKEGN